MNLLKLFVVSEGIQNQIYYFYAESGSLCILADLLKQLTKQILHGRWYLRFQFINRVAQKSLSSVNIIVLCLSSIYIVRLQSNCFLLTSEFLLWIGKKRREWQHMYVFPSCWVQKYLSLLT